MTVRDAIDSAADDERIDWEAAFAAFESCWNFAFRYVEMFDCLTIPQEYRQIKMSADQPLSFSLANEKDEGICPLALMQHLITLHNLLVDQGGHRSAAADISSRLIGNEHVAHFEWSHLLPYVEERCVAYTHKGDLLIDLAQAVAPHSLVLDRPQRTVLLHNPIIIIIILYCIIPLLLLLYIILHNPIIVEAIKSQPTGVCPRLV